MQRRSFIAALVYGTGVFVAPVHNLLASGGAALVYSAGSQRDNSHSVAMIDADSGNVIECSVSHRCHSGVVIPLQQQVVFISRRPGSEMRVMDRATGNRLQVVNAAPNRHFFGHGCLSRCGTKLYCAENAFTESESSCQGVIGIYDVTQQYRRIGEFSCQGVGPHQIERLPDSDILVVAVGGILTHPSRGREKLNLDAMQSAIHYIDANSGTVVLKLPSPYQQLSLRHFSVNKNHQLVVTGQYQGAGNELLELVFYHHYQGAASSDQLQAFEQDESGWLSLRQYIASVAIDGSGVYALTTGPRGDAIDLWDINRRQWLKRITLRDVAGVVWDNHKNSFVVSNGLGELYRVQVQPEVTIDFIARDKSLRWDNHLFS